MVNTNTRTISACGQVQVQYFDRIAYEFLFAF